MRRAADAVVVLMLLAFVGTLVGCGGNGGPSGPMDSVAKKPDKPPGGGGTEPSYALTHLQPLSGHAESVAQGMNQAGWVCGLSGTTYWTPVLWDPAAPNTPIQLDQGLSDGQALAVSDLITDGTDTGIYRVVGQLGYHAYIWEVSDTGGVVGIDLNVYGAARDTNAHGVVVGTAAGNVAIWLPGQPAYHSLGPGSASGISNSASPLEIVGMADGVPVLWEVTLDTDGSVVSVSTTEIDMGPTAHKADSPTAINDVGQVVGSFYAEPRSGHGGKAHAWLWDGAGPIADLGMLRSHEYSRASDINTVAGQIVGYSSKTAVFQVGTKIIQEYAAVTWEQPSLDIRDLNDLIATDLPLELREAKAINEAGQIGAMGVVEGIVGWRAYRLDPL